VALSHDPKLDDPALELALPSKLFYIGALGSRRTHEKRLERLRAAGLGELTGRIHSPIGLDLGGRAPAEIAVSILAEVIQVRYRGAASVIFGEFPAGGVRRPAAGAQPAPAGRHFEERSPSRQRRLSGPGRRRHRRGCLARGWNLRTTSTRTPPPGWLPPP
jgi:hypothetical protein